MPHIINTREITDDYNEIHIYEDDEKNTAKLEMWIAKNIGATLTLHYPNRQWGVEVNIPGRFVVVVAPGLSLTHGYHINMAGLAIQELQERAKLAAGEILERYGISRNRSFNPGIVEGLERDAVGNAIVNTGSTEGEDPIKRG
jgi:hypothetical protein